MHDIELYHHLLGLQPPWSVSRVDLALSEQRVDVWLGHAEGVRFACPKCGGQLPLYDHTESRVWRHLDSCQFLTYLHARPPRVDCPEHGVHQVRLPWAEPMSRFTSLFERLAIDVLIECDVQGAARLLRISWEEAWALTGPGGSAWPGGQVAGRAGTCGGGRESRRRRPRLPDRGQRSGRRHRRYLADERRQASLDGYFTRFTPAQRDQVQAVAMEHVAALHRLRAGPSSRP